MLKVKNKDEALDDEYQGYYRSLLGGLAWVSQTRMDAAVFIGALQRRLHKPTVGDVLNLNRVVNYVKSKPMRMTFRRLDQAVENRSNIGFWFQRRRSRSFGGFDRASYVWSTRVFQPLDEISCR